MKIKFRDRIALLDVIDGLLVEGISFKVDTVIDPTDCYWELTIYEN